MRGHAKRVSSCCELPHQRAARGTIRAMHLGVTIDAAAGKQKCARHPTRQALRRVHGGRMTSALMTRLTEKGRAHLEKRRLGGTMGIVTVGAVLDDRLVLPQERPAVFGVTGGAGFGDGVLDEQRRRRRAVRRMAGGAGHLSFTQRMMRWLEEIGVLRLVTGGTDLDLGGRGQHRIFGRVQRVTARARHVARGVRTRGPIMSGI